MCSSKLVHKFKLPLCLFSFDLARIYLYPLTMKKRFFFSFLLCFFSLNKIIWYFKIFCLLSHSLTALAQAVDPRVLNSSWVSLITYTGESPWNSEAHCPAGETNLISANDVPPALLSLGWAFYTCARNYICTLRVQWAKPHRAQD